jgi:hypothetical protein
MTVYNCDAICYLEFFPNKVAILMFSNLLFQKLHVLGLGLTGQMRQILVTHVSLFLPTKKGVRVVT